MTVSGESSKSPNLRLAILILAAGEGSRLGGYPKALLKKDGDSLLKYFVQSIQTLEPLETLIVTGFYSDQIEAEIKLIKQFVASPITWVKNLQPELGQASSIRLGLESLRSDYDVLTIALCDQPSIASTEIEALLGQFNQRAANQEIILPMVNGQRGNPVLFSRRVINQILSIPGMVCRPYMNEHPELVKSFTTDNKAYLMDVDTQSDIQKLGLDPI
ncbi:nucleotidyltransferase family protein [Polynucleobacter sp. MG-28-Ekke-A2]|uniref:nucleotidyltransferase family protein n=1 Tax=unclassified Polynucleobacter TaxID=2640945 RepID=UPI001C0E2068|nr:MULTISPECIES: nucleotidyltransferase family protein [unclassified Polynucleobacter]MBU3549012.1 nucleotidyltransferase family protein [Polynucleobacter sp. P1-05-14]MEA9601151.1 nucleotidyltransferase family protein [Polynucleobacter sp. MG-28-Ekke-A2]